jgi:hypothetical protein
VRGRRLRGEEHIKLCGGPDGIDTAVPILRESGLPNPFRQARKREGRLFCGSISERFETSYSTGPTSAVRRPIALPYPPASTVNSFAFFIARSSAKQICHKYIYTARGSTSQRSVRSIARRG